MTEQLYCDVAECDRPVAGHGKGKCSTHMKQLQRTGKTKPIAEKLNPEERAIAAGTAMLEADADGDYQRHRSAWLVACRALGDRERVAALRQSMAAAKARGKRIGRPPKVETKRVLELLRLLGRASLVAEVLQVHRVTVYKHLARCSEKERFATAKRPGPRLAG